MSTNTTNDRTEYYRARNRFNITFKVHSLELKNKIKEAAKKDNRSVQSWFDQYIHDFLDDLASKQLGLDAKKKR